MSELRTEVKTLRYNESAAERAEIIQLQKGLDSLNQQTREDLENLRNDVTIEMNNRKIATRAEQQMMEIKIQDLNNNFTKRLSDMRTEAEAQKWQTTRLLISIYLGMIWLILVTLVTMTICGFGVTRYLRSRGSEPHHTSEGVQTDFPREPRDPPAASSELVTLG
jgi:flagellar basal body-associated protein FliL